MFAGGVIAKHQHFGRRNDCGQQGARAMRHPIWDSHLAPRISTLEHQKLIVLKNTIRLDPLQFVITAVALEFIPLKRRVQTFNFIRRAQSPSTNTSSLVRLIVNSSLIETQFSIWTLFIISRCV
jgi:hypothetical protein